jgi:hypothetical protein
MISRKGMIAICFVFALDTVLSTAGTVSTWKKADLKKLKTKKSCVGCDLSGANLKGANMKSANLNGANLNGADLKNVNWPREKQSVAQPRDKVYSEK